MIAASFCGNMEISSLAHFWPTIKNGKYVSDSGAWN
jgi:hypothetical protein